MRSDIECCARLAGVGKRLGNRWIFRDVDAELPAGEVTAVIGASGSGKTTILRLINGLYAPDEGSVKVLGEPVPDHDQYAFRRNIGYAVQGAGLFPHMTVAENITKLAKLEGWPHERIAKRLDDLLELTDLAKELKTRFPYELSGGQQHRVSLCRALMLEPQVLLLDEPFSAIDAITRREIQDAFRVLQQQLQISAVLVTHDIQEAARLAQYLLVLAEGAVVQKGPTQAVLDDPEPTFLKNLVSTAS
ncbi:MAG: ATP-binding cassette domain-containing protein [Gammaproteobacteria bacterium]|nr:ATP-binding cassette domain-containing protein [Gammaproteobacteria bacterium]